MYPISGQHSGSKALSQAVVAALLVMMSWHLFWKKGKLVWGLGFRVRALRTKLRTIWTSGSEMEMVLLLYFWRLGNSEKYGPLLTGTGDVKDYITSLYS